MADNGETSCPLAYSVPEAARKIGISRNTLLRQAAAGAIEVKKVGRHNLVTGRELARFINAAPRMVSTTSAAR